jgi:hypothetical protein
MTHWISGLGVALVYMHMRLRSADLGARVRAAAEQIEPAASGTALDSAAIRLAREHVGTVEFTPHMPADTVDLLRQAHAKRRIYEREWNAWRVWTSA